jgi:hypothetical protein
MIGFITYYISIRLQGVLLQPASGGPLTGDCRLADALAECDERRWDALPLAASSSTGMSRGMLQTM